MLLHSYNYVAPTNYMDEIAVISCDAESSRRHFTAEFPSALHCNWSRTLLGLASVSTTAVCRIVGRVRLTVRVFPGAPFVRGPGSGWVWPSAAGCSRCCAVCGTLEDETKASPEKRRQDLWVFGKLQLVWEKIVPSSICADQAKCHQLGMMMESFFFRKSHASWLHCTMQRTVYAFTIRWWWCTWVNTSPSVITMAVGRMLPRQKCRIRPSAKGKVNCVTNWVKLDMAAFTGVTGGKD